ncbi:MAG: type II toxin-antitoxin system HicB family antitoxin [Elusimicrobia bacterium]|nr:type II toxin-antitoxin system HicB family antitoxin [Elusimicrobiota bacterium]
MVIRAVLEYDKEVKAFAVYCPELPGCTSCGETEALALKNFSEAVALYLEPSQVPLPRKAKVKELAL